MGHANRLNGGVPLAGMLNGALGEPEPWDMALDTENTLQGAKLSLPYEPTAAAGGPQAPQQAYSLPVAPGGAGSSVALLMATAAMFRKL